MTSPAPSFRTDLRTRLSQPGNRLSRLSAPWRRGLVVVAAAGTVAAVVLPWVFPGTALLVGSIGLVVSLFVSAALDLATRTVFQLPDAVLDERVRRRRERAAFLSLRILGPVLLVVAVVVVLAVGRPGWSAPVEQVLPAAVALALGAMSLPVWTLAWTEPAWTSDEDELSTAGNRPVGPFPWFRVAGQGVFFAVFTVVLRLLGWGGGADHPVDPGATITSGLIGGVLFTGLMALFAAWSRRRM